MRDLCWRAASPHARGRRKNRDSLVAGDSWMGAHGAEELERVADAIASADALLIGAGAGMGVDSGLPDFRGRQGFWNAYPPYAKLGLDFATIANPRWFTHDPALAWGFYGHRLELYRRTTPHQGFGILKRWADGRPLGAFVFTSNVDGHFQRAGFDPDTVLEVHGAIDWMQCTTRCGVGLFPADPYAVIFDESDMRAAAPLPSCPRCHSLARPNILMFGDGGWDSSRSAAQELRMQRWLASVRGRRIVIIECGAGTAIPTIRLMSEDLVDELGATLVRVNVREPVVPSRHIGLSAGALSVLQDIDRLLERRSSAS
jgi:NAD-dependent SIR2 family protein deacetylase